MTSRATAARENAPPVRASRVVKPGFVEDVARVVRTIPHGRVATYGDVAGALGARSVARHVGFALAALPHDTDVPWHRVVNAQGRVSARNDGVSADVQGARLMAEGVEIDTHGVIVEFAGVRLASLNDVK